MNKFLKHATRLGAVALCSAALCTLPAMAQGGGRGMMSPEQRQAQFDEMAKAVALTPDQIMATVNTILGSVAAENAETLALINGALTPPAPTV